MLVKLFSIGRIEDDPMEAFGPFLRIQKPRDPPFVLKSSSCLHLLIQTHE